MVTASAASTSHPSELHPPVNKTAHDFDKAVLDALLARRFFFSPAFEIYGGECLEWLEWLE
jgi:glycyl-tRNA synthetase